MGGLADYDRLLNPPDDEPDHHDDDSCDCRDCRLYWKERQAEWQAKPE